MAYIGSTPTNQYYSSLTERFNGDSSSVNFTLSRPVYTVYDIEVLVNNVQQDPFSAFTVNGTTTLTFTEAPSTGTGNILVSYKNFAVTRIVPEEGTITASSIQNGSITGDKLASATIGSSNLTTTGVSSGNYGGASSVPTITVDAQGRVSYAANVAIESGFNPFLLSGM